jgi:hypothetical protein
VGNCSKPQKQWVTVGNSRYWLSYASDYNKKLSLFTEGDSEIGGAAPPIYDSCQVIFHQIHSSSFKTEEP